MPQFYFHATTAYDILRHKGVPVVARLVPANPRTPSGDELRPGRGSWKGHIQFAKDWDTVPAAYLGLGPDGDIQ